MALRKIGYGGGCLERGLRRVLVASRSAYGQFVDQSSHAPSIHLASPSNAPLPDAVTRANSALSGAAKQSSALKPGSAALLPVPPLNQAGSSKPDVAAGLSMLVPVATIEFEIVTAVSGELRTSK